MKDNFCNFSQTSLVLYQQNICKDWKNLYVNKWNLQFQNRCNKAAIELCVMQFWSCLIMKFCKSFQRTQEKCQEEGTKSNCFFALLKCSKKFPSEKKITYFWESINFMKNHHAAGAGRGTFLLRLNPTKWGSS